MNTEQFQALVDDLARRERDDPAAFRRHARGFLTLGYAYITAVVFAVCVLLLFSLLLIAGAPGLGIMLALPLLALGWTTLRALWTRVPHPEGRRLRPDEAPRLFELARLTQAAARAPRVHEILLTAEMNAGIRQVPRLGLLGFHRHYLMVGMPLLLSTSREEFASVLAHEMGHLSRAHGRIGASVARQHWTWRHIEERMQESGRGRLAFGRFLGWYLPRLGARTVVLQRAQEREADLLAVQVAGSRLAADALVRVALASRLLDEGPWSAIRSRIEMQARPPEEGPMAATARVAKEPLPAAAATWLSDALGFVTTAVDSHPSLAERLAALGEAPRLPPPLSTSAAEDLLGSLVPALIREFDEQWRQGIADDWERSHAHARQKRLELERLESLPPSDENAELLVKRAQLVESLEGQDEALAAWRVVHERHPGDPRGSFHLGRLLLAANDPAGVEHLLRAMEAGREYRAACADMLFGWHDRRGERQQALEHARSAEALASEWDEATRERMVFLARRIAVGPHELDPAEEAAALAHLRGLEGIKRAWLVRRAVLHAPDIPAFVMVLELHRRWWTLREDKWVAQVAQSVADMPIPGTLVVLTRGCPTFAAWLRAARRCGPPLLEA